LIENYVSWFFHKRCFWSNALDHEFEKLMMIDVLFFIYVLFGFVISYIFFSTELSRFHYLSCWFSELVCLLFSGLQVCHASSDWIKLGFYCPFLTNFILLYLMGWELSYIVCSIYKNIFYQVVVIIFLICSICCYYLFFYH
jgi:hypothetical protein